MGNVFRTAFLAALMWGAGSAPAPAQTPAPPFDDFPALPLERQIEVKRVPSQYREEVRQALSEGRRFAGSAVFIMRGCGSGCAGGSIFDTATEFWYDIPFIFARDLGQDEPLFDFSPESTLIVSRGWMNEEEPGLFAFHWNGVELETVLDASDMSPRDFNSEFEQALDEDQAGDLQAALKSYRRALALATTPDERKLPLINMAHVLTDEGRLDAAVVNLARAVEILPDDERVKGEVDYFRSVWPERALALLDRLMDDAPAAPAAPAAPLARVDGANPQQAAAAPAISGADYVAKVKAAIEREKAKAKERKAGGIRLSRSGRDYRKIIYVGDELVGMTSRGEVWLEPADGGEDRLLHPEVPNGVNKDMYSLPTGRVLVKETDSRKSRFDEISLDGTSRPFEPPAVSGKVWYPWTAKEMLDGRLLVFSTTGDSDPSGHYFIYDGVRSVEFHKAPPGHTAYHSGLSNVLETRFRVREGNLNKEYRRLQMIDGDSLWQIYEWPVLDERSGPYIRAVREGQVLTMRHNLDSTPDNQRVGFSLHTRNGERQLTDANQPLPETISLTGTGEIVWRAYVATDTHPGVDCGGETRCEAVFIAGNGPPRQVYNTEGLPSRLGAPKRIGGVVLMVDDGRLMAAYDGKVENLGSLPRGSSLDAYPDRLVVWKDGRRKMIALE